MISSRYIYALIFGLVALLLVLCSALVVSAGEPPTPARRSGSKSPPSAAQFLKGGWRVLAGDGRFRLFLYSQWLGGATLMALPFYVVAACPSGIGAARVLVSAHQHFALGDFLTAAAGESAA